MRAINVSLDNRPLLSARLVREPLAITLEATLLSSDAKSIASSADLFATDGVEQIRVSGLAVSSRVDNGDGTVIVHAERVAENVSEVEVLEALRQGESLVLSPSGGVSRTANNRTLPSDPTNTLAYKEERIEKPSELRAFAPRVVRHELLDNGWTPVVRDADGQWLALEDALNDWGVDHDLLKDVLLHPEDIARLGLSDEAGERLLCDAYRAFRFDGDLPRGKPQEIVRLRHDAFQAANRPSDIPIQLAGMMRDGAAMLALDDEGRPIVIASQLLVHLEAKAGAQDKTTLHGYRISDAAKIAATLAFIEDTPTIVATLPLGGAGAARDVAFPSFIAFEDNASGSSSSEREEALRAEALNALAEIAALLPEVTRRAEYSGAIEIVPTAFESIEIIADAEHGLRTTVRPKADSVATLARALNDTLKGREVLTAAPSHASVVEDFPQPRNASRGGPLIIRDDVNTDKQEALAFATLVDTDAESDALSLEHFGRLAQPFWVDDDKGESGAYFLAAPIKLIDGGVALIDEPTTLADFTTQPEPTTLGDSSPIPRGSDGLLLQGPDGATHLALYDRALVAQHRGDSPAHYSSMIREIEGEWLDPSRQGALHQLTMVTFSPQALRQSSGSGSPSAWVAALNFRGAATATPQGRALDGHGRFAEADGKSIGHLAHFPDQGGPIIADAKSCEKHSFGEASALDGIYRECAGHLSTEAFFKIAGSKEYDAPLLFQDEKTDVGVGKGREYRAEIKLDPTMTHHFREREVPGRWVVTYRIPFFDCEPPFWDPQETPPWVFDRNLAGPSYDWVPPVPDKAPPEDGEEDDWRDVPFPGVVLSSTGYAVEDDSGNPTPALGGGAVIMPGGVYMNDGPDFAFEGGMRWFVLHPKVGLGFGLPDMSSDGAPRSGFRIALNDGDLEVAALDSNGDADLSAVLRLAVPLALEAGFSGPLATVSGSRSDGSALEGLLSALDSLGLIDDESVA